MKKIQILFLVAILLTASSFKQERDNSSFEATVDGVDFKLREGQLFRGLMVNKKAAMDGKIPARTVISSTIHGVSYAISPEKEFSESIQFEIGYDSLKLVGIPSYFALALQYKSGNYYMVKEESNLVITALEWEADKKHFRISADYDCKMRSRNFPADGKSDVALKGRIINFRITVPSWMAPKN